MRAVYPLQQQQQQHCHLASRKREVEQRTVSRGCPNAGPIVYAQRQLPLSGLSGTICVFFVIVVAQLNCEYDHDKCMCLLFSCMCVYCHNAQSGYFDCDDSDTFSENSFGASDLEEQIAVQQQHQQQYNQHQQQHHHSHQTKHNAERSMDGSSSGGGYADSTLETSPNTVTNPNYCNNNTNHCSIDDCAMSAINVTCPTPETPVHQQHTAAVNDDVSDDVAVTPRTCRREQCQWCNSEW